MTELITPTEIENSPLILHLHPVIQLTNDQFFEFCQLNQDLRFERTARGELLIMPPTGTGTGGRNFRLIGQLFVWTEQNKTGIGFDSSTGFILPNGSTVSPDAAWIKLERWNALSTEQQEKFAAISPDFVVELRSSSENLTVLKAKMQEYINNGVKLGWLIARKYKKVYIYRPQMLVECLDNPVTVSGDLELPGFVLNMSKIW